MGAQGALPGGLGDEPLEVPGLQVCQKDAAQQGRQTGTLQQIKTDNQ